jgi:hypothetical protein
VWHFVNFPNHVHIAEVSKMKTADTLIGSKHDNSERAMQATEASVRTLEGWHF